MNIQATKRDVVDADISRLFARQKKHTSPVDLDKRILEAAAFAVQDFSDDRYRQERLKKNFRPSFLTIGVVLFVVFVLLYSLSRSFLELPAVLQDASRVFSEDSAHTTYTALFLS